MAKICSVGVFAPTPLNRQLRTPSPPWIGLTTQGPLTIMLSLAPINRCVQQTLFQAGMGGWVKNTSISLFHQITLGREQQMSIPIAYEFKTSILEPILVHGCGELENAWCNNRLVFFSLFLSVSKGIFVKLLKYSLLKQY